MTLREIRASLRRQAEEEAAQFARDELETKQLLRRWRWAAVAAILVLAAGVLGLIKQYRSLVVSLSFMAFVWAAVMSYGHRFCLGALRKQYREESVAAALKRISERQARRKARRRW